MISYLVISAGDHSGSFCSFYIRFTAGQVPSGLDSKIKSPISPKLGLTYSSCRSITLATPPIIGQGFIMDQPPVILVPASVAQSLKPRIISRVITSRACSDIIRETPRIMSMWSTLGTPIAQRSESTLQQAILPYMQGSSTSGQKKSVVEMSLESARSENCLLLLTWKGVTEQSGVSLAMEPSPISLRYWNSLSCGTLQPQPFSVAQSSKLKLLGSPNLLWSKLLICGRSLPKCLRVKDIAPIDY